MFVDNTANVSISNATITANTAEIGGGVSTNNGQLSITLVNSIVAGNSASDAANEIEIFSQAATVTASASNVFGESSHTTVEAFLNFTPGTLDLNGSSDISGGGIAINDLLVSNLADNGGSTRTHALQANSPARNFSLIANCPAQDQRSEARNTNDGFCDTGAYEFIDETGFVVIPLGNGRAVVVPL